MSLCTLCTRTGHTAGQCPLNRRWIAPLLATGMAVLVTACATPSTPPPSPSARLMAPPAEVAEIKPGDDLVVAHLKLRKQYYREAARLRSLQGYVRVSRGETAK